MPLLSIYLQQPDLQYLENVSSPVCNLLLNSNDHIYLRIKQLQLQLKKSEFNETIAMELCLKPVI